MIQNASPKQSLPWLAARDGLDGVIPLAVNLNPAVQVSRRFIARNSLLEQEIDHGF